MRIVTLLPSATEVVAALGLGDHLVGISHECDYPRDVVANKPVVTRSALPPGLSAAEIDQVVRERIHRGESLYALDYELLDALKPDLIITQELCEVCAVAAPLVRAAVCRLARVPQIISLEPTTVEGIFETVRTVAAAAGVSPRAERVIADLRARLANIARRLRAVRTRPCALALEWLLPPFSAGHWVPEMIAYAGGREMLARAGEKSRRVDWASVLRAQPEYLFLMPCGYNLAMIERELAQQVFPSEWWDLPAVRQGKLYALDANSFFSRPSPRVVEGIEILAGILHPDLFPPPPDTDARCLVSTQLIL
jgi:iron complex transport system substrate-binding protein